MEKVNMQNRDDRSQCDREAQTRPPGQEKKHTLEEFWRHQLGRIKERAESPKIRPASFGS
jgi:hypothetical protein